MTVADLIVELQQHPAHKRVHVTLACVTIENPKEPFGSGEFISIDRAINAEAEAVSNQGGYILIEGGEA